MFLKLLRFSLIGLFLLAVVGALTAFGTYYYLAPSLPSTEVLKDVQLQTPMRIYAQDGTLIGEYGQMKRSPLRYDQIPERMIQAIIAAEDDRFFVHPGVDYQGLLRAVFHLIRTGEKGQGGSTITMQVARNFFLSREKTYLRKLSEIFLALKIERELGKEDILELYLNKIYLGHRSYGVAAAAQVYYGKELQELDLPQFAMIAGLPKAPSRYNPVVNPERATIRRNYVLGRMHGLGFISDAEYERALASGVSARLHAQAVELEAPYIAEMVRAEMVERFGEEAYTAGYRVVTTLRPRLQVAANRALRQALLEYDQRHGYRGPEGHVELAPETDEAAWRAALEGFGSVGPLLPAVVVAVEADGAVVYTPEPGLLWLDWEALAWARPYLSENSMGPEPRQAGDILKPGDIIRIEPRDCGWSLSQVPEVGGALVSLDPQNGAVLALVGGFDFFHSKFNRVTQAQRQPGSNFKPFIYSAALESGLTPASVINDAPVVFEDAELEASWRPENYSGRFYGPTRLREALVRSRNLVSIRVLRSIGIGYALDYLDNFGFDREQLPRDLSLALGSASITPLQLVGGYAVFANGGYQVHPYYIERIEDADGTVLERAEPLVVCEECEQAPEVPEAIAEAQPVEPPQDPDTAAEAQVVQAPAEPPAIRPAPQVLEPRNVYLIKTMMQDVIRRGTGRRALVLGRNDLAGKTGTTNEQRDAWFSGFNRNVVTTAWVGFDTPRPLGNRETGARAALPMWIAYMREALDGMPEQPLEQPPGMVTVRIDPETGQFTDADNPNAIFETFRVENVPEQGEPGQALPEATVPGTSEENPISEQLF